MMLWSFEYRQTFYPLMLYCRLLQISNPRHRTEAMIESIKELYESGDEYLHQTAELLLISFAGEPQFIEEYATDFIEQYLYGKSAATFLHIRLKFDACVGPVENVQSVHATKTQASADQRGGCLFGLLTL
jgi:hypothetical protein